jgi:Ca2+-binding RTX toxin-like protein
MASKRPNLITGTDSSDLLSGTDRTDVLIGLSGDDTLRGDAGDDILEGGGGRDVIRGGAGYDLMTGGAGDDLFVLERGGRQDDITDFVAGADRIGLAGGLQFADLTILARGRDTLIKAGNEKLASIKNVKPSELSDSDFARLFAERPADAHMQEAAHEGVWITQMPVTPNGLRPVMSWNAIMGASDGSIYVSGSDHVTNAAMYRIADDGDQKGIWYIGDARSASEAAGNWINETAEKFHTKPLEYDGNIYVATTDYSNVDDGYLQKRGFHWYAYNTAGETFEDLSASEPGGVGAEHLQIMTTAVDPDRGVIYGLAVPTGELFAYDVDQGVTSNLGRPDAWNRDYVYAARAMWIDTSGKVYFSAGHPDPWPSNRGPYDQTIFGHIYYYDPETGMFGERPDWRLGKSAIDAGEFFPDIGKGYFFDALGGIFEFDEAAQSFEQLDQIPGSKPYTWMTQISEDRTKAYLGVSFINNPQSEAQIFEFDFAARTLDKFADAGTLDPRLSSVNLVGNNAWDDDGTFYFTSFRHSAKADDALAYVVGVNLEQFTQSRFVHEGSAGDESLGGSNGDDLMRGLAGNDTLEGGTGVDTLIGGSGDDLLLGGDHGDRIEAGAGGDTLVGGDGNDFLWGYLKIGGSAIDGDDSIDGGAGNDNIAGHEGNDTIIGGTGNDTLAGQAGDDSLVGGDGNDIFFAGDGNDALIGGGGIDTLSGNGGNDLYVFADLAESSVGAPDVVDGFDAPGRPRVTRSTYR